MTKLATAMSMLLASGYAGTGLAAESISCNLTPKLSIIAEGETVQLTAECDAPLETVNWFLGTQTLTGNITIAQSSPTPINFTTPIALGTGAGAYDISIEGVGLGATPETVKNPEAGVNQAKVFVKPASALAAGNGAGSGANDLVTPVNGQCGSANGGSASAVPSGTAACAAGHPTLVITSPSAFSWTCESPNGGTDASCYALFASPVAGSCGSANGGNFASQPSSSLCSAGNGTPSWSDSNANDNTWNWTCGGANGGASSAECSANKVLTAVNGTCGSASGGTFSAQPSANLCGNGSGVPSWSDQAGTDGTWNWTCGGANGGTQSPACSATNSVAPVAGTCGSANNGNFVTQPSSNLCGAGNGTPNWSDTDATDGTWNWSCGGSNGAASSGTCSANKVAEGQDPGPWTGLWLPPGTTNVFVVDPSGAQGSARNTYLPGCINQKEASTYLEGCATETIVGVGQTNVGFGNGAVISVRYKSKATPTGGSFKVTGTDGGSIYQRPWAVWLSTTPAGPVTHSFCRVADSTSATISTYSSRCAIQPNTLYYLNFQSDNGGQFKILENADFLW